MRAFPTALLFVLTIPAFGALRPNDVPAAQAIVTLGAHAFDATSGLLKGPGGAQSVVEYSGGYIAACFATGQNIDQARIVLGKILDAQRQTGPQQGLFPWYADPGNTPSEDATCYLLPLLSYIYRTHSSALGPDLRGRLQIALTESYLALNRIQATSQQEVRFLLRAAAKATVGAALGNDGPAAAAGDVAEWLRFTTVEGLPAGHSATFDATKYVALKWIREVASPLKRGPVDQALALTALDLALRVDPMTQYLAGALTESTVSDYESARGFASYVLYTDFGLPLPAEPDPYLMAALLPSWHAPQGIVTLADGSAGLVRTHSTRGLVRATDTYIGPGFSLGTMCGQVAGSTIPVFATFPRNQRPTLFFYCEPAPCTVQSVQSDGLALVSFNFDNMATARRRQAMVHGTLGSADDISDVYCYGVRWNDLPTSLGERESLAFATHGCYVGVTMLRVGPASDQQGSAAKSATLRWSQEGRKGELCLTMYARQADYLLARPLNDVRAGFVIEIVPQSAYLSIEEFIKHLQSNKVKQTVRALRQRVPTQEKPRDPNVLIPQPRSKADLVYRNTLEQVSEYTIGSRTLALTEDLLSNTCLSRSIDGTTLEDLNLWDSERFKLTPGGNLTEALEPTLK